MGDILQQSFSGGMRLDSDPAKLQENEYQLLINGRSRYDNIELINAPLLLTALGGVNFQGLYAAGRYAIVFIDGLAYYKDFQSGGNFTQIPDFQMDANVDYIYAVLVPSSNRNLFRKAGTNANADIILTSVTAASPQSIVVQDGVNQPMLIDPSLGVREANTYGKWTTDDREYVPIGKQMAYVNNKLYIVSIDGKEIYQSVTGRPLDFVVAIDEDGNKLSAVEEEHGAAAVSIGVDFNAITLIASGSVDGSLLVTTDKNSYLLVPTNTYVYGEPEYIYDDLFSTGALNQFCVTDILGDTALISFSGIHSFNAARQLRNEGQNAPFSSSVYRLFKGIVQSSPCCVNFDDYAMFAVDTIYGSGILVYDTMRGKFNSLDIYDDIGYIKMFAEVKVQGVRKLLFLTTTGVYEFEGGDVTATCKLLTKQYSVLQPTIEHKPHKAHALFSEVNNSINGSVRAFADNQSKNSYGFSITAGEAATDSEIPIPLTSKDNVKSVGRDIGAELTGNKLQLLLSWSGGGELTSLSLKSSEKKRDTSARA